MVGGGVAIANFADYQFKLTGDLGHEVGVGGQAARHHHIGSTLVEQQLLGVLGRAA